MLEHLNASAVSPKRVVILGARGFVGAAAERLLRSQGVPVLALGRAELDLLSADAAERLARALQSDDSLLVISARAPVKDAAMLAENVRMMEHICRALAGAPLRHAVYISSDAVYRDSTTPLTEESCAEPSSLHGAMHLARELMLKSAVIAPLAILRPSLLYGAADPHNGYGPNRFRRLAAAGQEIVLFGEGEERRDHVHIDDVAELIWRVLARRSRGNTQRRDRRGCELSSDRRAHRRDGHAGRGSPRQPAVRRDAAWRLSALQYCRMQGGVPGFRLHQFG